MWQEYLEPVRLLDFLNVALSSTLVILAFSLLAYTLTYNFRNSVARRFAFLLACVMVTFAGDVALHRVAAAESAGRWLRFQWLGIAMLPAAAYLFSLAVLRATNFRVGRKRWLGWIILALSLLSAVDAIAGSGLVGEVRYSPPISYLQAGPYFEIFAGFYVVVVILGINNLWRARERCLTGDSRQRMTYLLVAFAAPAIGIFPYLIGASRVTGAPNGNGVAEAPVLLLSLVGNSVVAAMLVVMAYTVAYFGVLTPDRVVRYRLIRFFIRGPVVAIMVIIAIQTLPRVEILLGLPRDVVLFSVITGVIVLSQLILSVTKSLVDRLVYREDRDEIVWLRELDRRLLTTSDLRQFLENNLVVLCELLRVPSGFVAAASGADLLLEAVVGPPDTRSQVTNVSSWGDALANALKEAQAAPSRMPAKVQPLSHQGFWVWPLISPVAGADGPQVLGLLGVRARTEAPLLSRDESAVLETMIDSVAKALLDRQLQQGVFVALERIIPDIERIQQMRVVIPYSADGDAQKAADALLNPSPIHSPEFEAWVKDALSHYWGGPKLTRSPLVQLRVVADAVDHADGNPTKALRLVLGQAIERLRPEGKQNLSAPEWLLYNILEMRFIQGRKVREIAERLAMSESDLYRKQRVAIGHLARVLSDMEQANGIERTGPAGRAADYARASDAFDAGSGGDDSDEEGPGADDDLHASVSASSDSRSGSPRRAEQSEQHGKR